MSILVRSVLAGMAVLGTAGAAVGLVLGLRAYAPTAWAAVFEVGIPAAVVGAALGLAVGVVAVRVRRCHTPMAAFEHIQICVGRLVAQFLAQKPIHAHAQSSFDKILGPHVRDALTALGIKQIDNILVRQTDQFRHVLDCHQPPAARDGMREGS